MRKKNTVAPAESSVESVLKFLDERKDNTGCKILHTFENNGSVILSTNALLENGRQAMIDEHPCFHIDGTGTETSERWRILYLCCSTGCSVFPVCLCLCPTEKDIYYEELLKCCITEGAIADLAKVTIISDNGPTDVIQKNLKNAKHVDCFSHLINRTFTPNIRRFSTSEMAHRFIADAKRLARSWTPELFKWGCTILKGKYSEEEDGVTWFFKYHVAKNGNWHQAACPVGVTTSNSGIEGMNNNLHKLTIQHQPFHLCLGRLGQQKSTFNRAGTSSCFLTERT